MINKFGKLLFNSIIMLLSFNAYAAFDLNGTLTILPDTTVGIPISGVVDFDTATIDINSVNFLDDTVTFISGEILPPGRHKRTNISLNSTHSRTVTIPEDKTGGYFVMSWKGETFAIFTQWDTPTPLKTFVNVPFFANIIRQGPLYGKEVGIDFETVEQGMFVHPSITINGGAAHECSLTGGTTISIDSTVTMNASATLASIDWVLDGVPVTETGMSISVFAGLGTHVIEATATTDEGISETTSASFSVIDTTDPTTSITFIDSSGQPVTSATDGNIELSITATDICDDSITDIRSSAYPVMNVVDGDLIRIIQQDNNVILPTTAVEVTATATDGSGNSNTVVEILQIQ